MRALRRSAAVIGIFDDPAARFRRRRKFIPVGASRGLLRSTDLELGKDLLVAGYPYGGIFSNTIKVTKGIASVSRGLRDNTGQFQADDAVQPGNSGGPIYDENGNVVGVVISQLNKMKFTKMFGSIPAVESQFL